VRYFKEFYRFIGHIVSNRSLLVALIRNDFKKQYLGSYLGLAWAFIQPLTFMVVIWFVFEVGFRAGPVHGDAPFFLWLMCGMVPWFFFADALRSGTNSIMTNSFLVKKVAFRVSILPLVDIGSALLIHLGLLGFLVVAFFLYGYYPSIFWLQLPFYLLCTVVLVLGIAWLTSAINVFIKDVGNVISVFLQMGFWLTPIFWTLELVPERFQYLIKLNPAYYIVDGYRNTFLNEVWFWEQHILGGYFLLVTLCFLAIGALVFKRLRPHFADVL
jgi:lipopolysaccharide transport system permease protein/teichoic acid transport system permease protein